MARLMRCPLVPVPCDEAHEGAPLCLFRHVRKWAARNEPQWTSLVDQRVGCAALAWNAVCVSIIDTGSAHLNGRQRPVVLDTLALR